MSIKFFFVFWILPLLAWVFRFLLLTDPFLLHFIYKRKNTEHKNATMRLSYIIEESNTLSKSGRQCSISWNTPKFCLFPSRQIYTTNTSLNHSLIQLHTLIWVILAQFRYSNVKRYVITWKLRNRFSIIKEKLNVVTSRTQQFITS